MKPQIAHLYRNGKFFGYALAINGELIDCQASTDISTKVNEIPSITAIFNIDSEMADNPIRIDMATGSCLP